MTDTYVGSGREVYKPRRFKAASLALIDHANAIIAEYQAADFKLALRQLYYQFVARDLFQNTFKNYKLLGRTMVFARNAGESDWDAMEDRSRTAHYYASWSDPREFVQDVIADYAEDLWKGQRFRPEVWVEKDALIDVVASACDPWRVPHRSAHGDAGQLGVREAGLHFADQLDLGYIPVVLHLTDHDPKGIAMTKDIRRRLELYARAPIEVRRIALNMDQVRRYRPPPNFAKETDTNIGKYRREFGTDECWELDALAPDAIAALIRDEVEEMIDHKRWAEAVRSEQHNKMVLDKIAGDLK
jgi:hypothetical protein